MLQVVAATKSNSDGLNFDRRRRRRGSGNITMIETIGDKEKRSPSWGWPYYHYYIHVGCFVSEQNPQDNNNIHDAPTKTLATHRHHDEHQQDNRGARRATMKSPSGVVVAFGVVSST